MLRATELTKRFGTDRTALHGVSFVVPDGEICALLGPNGAGKTTAIGCFVDLVRPDDGIAEVDGVAVPLAPVAARRGVAYLAEQVALYPALTGRENVRFFAGLAGRSCTSAAAADALARLGLAPRSIDQPVRTYSKGMRQRVGLAVAALSRARNVILDEPTSGLDPIAARELTLLLRDMGRDGTAVLTSSHDLAQTAGVADSFVCLHRGRVVGAARASALPTAGLAAWFASRLAGADVP